MKRMRVTAAVCLLAAIIFSAGACKNSGNILPEGTYELKNSRSIKPGEAEMPLDPAEVYASLDYIPEMFYGTYISKEEPSEAVKSENTAENADETTEAPEPADGLPSGLHAARASGSAESGLYPMTLTFKTAEGIPSTKDCTYTVEGSKLRCKLVSGFKYDASNNIIACCFTGEELEYDFEFSGAALTLSSDGGSVELVSEMFAKNPPSFYFSGYSSADHDAFDSLRHLEFSWGGTTRSRLLISDIGRNVTENAVAYISKNGLFTLTVPEGRGSKTVQFVYFYASSDELVLANKNGTYCFNSDWFDAYRKSLVDNLTPEEAKKLENLTEDELAELTERKNSLISDIENAFSEVGISVEVNKNTGELVMDSSVLFGGDSSEISESGREALKKISKAYASVIFNESYADFVSSIKIEGHTAPTSGSTYEEDLPLSAERARNVKAYCTSAETGIEKSVLEKLKTVMTPVGMSSSDPVYDENGDVDMAASRRVSFSLVINIAAPEKEAAEKPGK